MTPTPEQEVAVLKSVTYAALFDYPLALEQLHASLVGVAPTPAAVLSWWQRSEFSAGQRRISSMGGISRQAVATSSISGLVVNASAANCSLAMDAFCA